MNQERGKQAHVGGETPTEQRTVVSPGGTDTENGTALLRALAAIVDASQHKKYLLYVEAGTYDLCGGTLQMQQHVDIEGAGELSTLITSSATSFEFTKATLRGANNAELRFLTVRNAGIAGPDGNSHVAILNIGASPRLTHVTALATGDQSINIGVLNVSGSPAMTDVTVTASGDADADNVGVRNVFSSPTIKQSTLNGSDNSLLHESGSAKVALTQLVGPITRTGGTLQCFDNYDDNLNAVTCGDATSRPTESASLRALLESQGLG
jgi:hypothetical protein